MAHAPRIENIQKINLPAEPAQPFHPKQNGQLPRCADALDIGSTVRHLRNIRSLSQLCTGGTQNLYHPLCRCVRKRWIDPYAASHRADLSCLQLRTVMTANDIRLTIQSTQRHIGKQIRVPIKDTYPLIH